MGYFGVAATPLPHTTSLIYGACRAGQARQTRSLGYASPRQQFHRGFSHRRRTPSGKNSIPAFSSASVTFSMRSVS